MGVWVCGFGGVVQRRGEGIEAEGWGWEVGPGGSGVGVCGVGEKAAMIGAMVAVGFWVLVLLWRVGRLEGRVEELERRKG